MRLRQALSIFIFLGFTLPVFATECPKALLPGVELYKQARYAEAIDAFRVVTSSQPNCLYAWLYLATSYAQQYVPGADSKEDLALAE